MTNELREAIASARWYCVSNDGRATLCVDKDDATQEAAAGDLRYPGGAPYKAAQLVDVRAIAALASTSEQAGAPTLCERLQQKCTDWGTYWRAPDAHGVELSHDQAVELLRDALGVEVEIARHCPSAPLAQQQGGQGEAAFEVVLTDEETSFLRAFMGEDEGEAPSPIRLQIGDGHDGYGVYVSLVDYPEEGSSLLTTLAAQPPQAPPVDHFVDANKMVAPPAAPSLTDQLRQPAAPVGVPKLLGWRTDDYLMETADRKKAENWSTVHTMLPIFEGDPYTKLAPLPDQQDATP
jgi:hypothetical protein